MSSLVKPINRNDNMQLLPTTARRISSELLIFQQNSTSRRTGA